MQLTDMLILTVWLQWDPMKQADLALGLDYLGNVEMIFLGERGAESAMVSVPEMHASASYAVGVV